VQLGLECPTSYYYLSTRQLKQRDEIATRQLARKDQEDVASQVVNILISEFGELSLAEQDFINSILENRSKALLFLAQTPERRRIWVPIDYIRN
jgi:hypothetical protein